jgi:hypothetical protein
MLEVKRSVVAVHTSIMQFKIHYEGLITVDCCDIPRRIALLTSFVFVNSFEICKISKVFQNRL